MTPDPRSKAQPAAAPRAAPPAPPAGSRRRRRVRAAALLVAVGALGWWWFRGPTAEPPFPADVHDPEVRTALEAARQQVRAAPRSAAAWGRFGLTLQAHTYVPEADQCFAEASRLDPADGSWPYYRGLNVHREDPGSALPYLKQAAAGRLSKEHQTAVRLRLAEALLERHELTEAEALFLAEWKAQPGDARAGYGLGLVALARGDGAAAEKYLTAARANSVVRKSATAQLAVLARDRGDAATAAALDQEVAALPNEAPVWPDPLVAEMMGYRVGAYKEMQDTAQLEAQHRYADAAKVYLRRIEHNPTAENYVGAGLNLVRSGNEVAGLKLLQKGVSTDPNRCESHYGLALARFQLAAQQPPNSRAGKDHFQEAAAAARRATELKPDYAEAYLLWGGALMGGGDPTAAIVPLKQGVSCRPELFNLQMALGNALMEAGQLDDAEIAIKNAMKLEPKNEQPRLALEQLRKKRK